MCCLCYLNEYWQLAQHLPLTACLTKKESFFLNRIVMREMDLLGY